MKKTYINPELEVVKIQTMQMLAASDTDVDISTDPVTPGTPGEAPLLYVDDW